MSPGTNGHARGRCGAAGKVLGLRELKRLGRRETILAVAADSFLTNGYAGTSMSAIAMTLGGSKSTLWSYFPSKAALFEATLDHAIEKHHARLSENLNPDGDLAAALGRFATVFVGTVTSPRAIALHRLVQGEAGRFPEVGEIFYRRVTRRTCGLLAGFLANAMGYGLLREDDPLVAARTFTALCMGGTYQLLMLGQSDWPGPEDIEQDVAQVLSVFLRAYAPDGSPSGAGPENER